MIAILGGKCRACGATNCLTFDCIKPTGDEHHRLSSVGRVCYYEAQMRRGNVQLLCSECNSKKGAKPEPAFRVLPGALRFSSAVPDVGVTWKSLTQ